MPGQVKAVTPALRQSAIRQVALRRRNPFFADQRIELRNKDWGRRPGERVRASQAFQAAARLAEDCVAACAQVIGVSLGFLTGLALAVPLIVLPMVIAGFLLYADYSHGAKGGAFLFNQSWRHYAGWTLSGATAFFCPYLVLGIPAVWVLRFFRPIRGFFDARKLSRVLENDSGNNDPSVLAPARAIEHRAAMERRPFSRPVTSILWGIAGAAIAFSGVWTLASFVILYLKLGALVFKSEPIVGIIAIGPMCIGLLFPYQLLHSRMGVRAIEHFIISLSRGRPYGQALGQALSEFSLP